MFNSLDLSVLAYANNFTLWHYIAKEDDISDHGYFNKAALIMRVGDLIIARDKGGTEFFVVTENDGDTVVVKPY